MNKKIDANNFFMIIEKCMAYMLGMDTVYHDKKDKTCKHCKRELSIRNPSGKCDHLYYPENCKICKKNEAKKDAH